MILTYEAVDADGKSISDVIEAPDTAQAIDQLRQKGLFVMSIQERRHGAAVRQVKQSKKAHLPLKSLVFFTRQMAMLLKAGSALVPAMNAVRPQLRKPENQRLVNELVDGIEDGATLAEVMAKFPKTFSASYRAVVAAGEASATIAEMFERLAGSLARKRAVRNKVIGSLIYPALLIVLAINVITSMLLFVVPRFSKMFETLGAEVPASTQALVSISTWLTGHWYVLVGAVVLAVGGLLGILFSDRGRQMLSNIQIRVPVVGRLMSRLIQAEMYRTLGMLLECRVGVLEALELTRGVTRNGQFQKLFDQIDDTITTGGNMSGPLRSASFVDPSVAYCVQTGEESGNLGLAVTYCADVMEEDNAELISTMTKLIEPVILILMGLVVGGVAISLFMPLFDLTSAIN